MKGYEQANLLALELWEDVYPTTLSNSLHIALTDTFTSQVFFNVCYRRRTMGNLTDGYFM